MAGDEAEILEEIAFHLDMRTRDCEREGLEPDEARQVAEARFGSVERVIGECLKVRTGGRVMLQRINLAMVAVLIAAVGVLGWRMVEDTARRADEMQELRGDISKLIDRRGQQLLEEQFPDLPKVYLLGCVEKPGAVLVNEKRPMSLCRAISMRSGFSPYARTSAVKIIRKSTDGKPKELLVDFDAILEGDLDDPILEPEDIVYVPESIF